MTEELDTQRPFGLIRNEPYVLPTQVGILFADAHDVLAQPLPWTDLPDIDTAADIATEHAATLIDPEYLEWQASRRECDNPDSHMSHDVVAPLYVHERETAALLHASLRIAAPLVRKIMVVHGLTHDDGKRHPAVAAQYRDGQKWSEQKVDHLSERHQHFSEQALVPYILNADSPFHARVLEVVARLNGIHHHRNLRAIRDMRLRWMAGVFQEADAAQSLLLAARSYMSDGTTREGISLQNIDALYGKIVKPFHAPPYYGVEPGRIFNIALGWREQRLKQMSAS